MTRSKTQRQESNRQQSLPAALARVRTALERYIARRDEGEAEAPAPQEPPTSEAGSVEQLCTAFNLSPFERDTLLLCAAIDLDGSFAALCARAHNDPSRPYPTFSLALAALPGAHWSALTPAAPLRRLRLIDVGTGSALTLNHLRIDERVLHFLTGVNYLDERLAGIVSPITEQITAPLVPSHHHLADQLAAAWATGANGVGWTLIQLCGDDRAAKRAIALAACEKLGLTLCALPADALPAQPAELDLLGRLWEREGALSRSALLVDCDELDMADPRNAQVLRLLERTNGALILTSRDRRRSIQRPVVTVDVQRPNTIEQRQVWERALAGTVEDPQEEIDLLVAQFDLSAQSILNAGTETRARLALTPEVPPGVVLWDVCRTQSRPRLEDLAQRIETVAGWDDLVLPPAQRQILRDIAAHVRQRSRVYDSWGFAKKGARGLGISAMFAGTSGTGKTMAAEVLARELGLDLYRIDLSSVVSKYIGETEKNLRRIFDAAEMGGAILLFDEADALFGKRSEVKDSHDRYANIEVSYLLQRMEAYRGLAILTTNLKNALDTAFLRRIRFVIQFPFPDATQRAEIWRKIFPPDTPTEGLAVERLARLNVAGGNIRNIALNAAFLAADAKEPVRMLHVLRATRAEYAKLEKSLTEAEIAGWV